MSTLIQRRRSGLWTPNRKPPLQSRINWQHPIVRPADGKTTPSLIYCALGNEAGGNQLFDIAGNNTGTFQGNDVLWDADSIAIGDTDDYISVPHNSQLNFSVSTGFTVVVEVSFNDLSAKHDICSKWKDEAGKREFLLQFDEGADAMRLLIRKLDDSANVIATGANGSVTETNKFYATAGTVAKDSTIQIYLNGQPSGASAAGAGIGNGDIDFHIGMHLDGSSLPVRELNGNIKYLYLFNRALSASEVFQVSWDKYCFIESLRPNRGALWESVAAGGIRLSPLGGPLAGPLGGPM